MSYKLSALGTDGTLSIKSGFISNMSVRTPRSVVSMQSSFMSNKRNETFSHYRTRSNVPTTTDDIFKAAPSTS